jgi:DnaB helicase-like protein
MRLTFVQSERDNSTAWRADWEWAEAAHHLTQHRRLPAKGELGVIFARFVDGPCRRLARTGKCTDSCPGVDHRVDENVETVTALGLDFDDAPKARLESLIVQLRTRGTKHVWYTTWGSTEATPKIRVVLALDAEIPAAQFRGFWDAVVDHLQIRDIVDTKCRNPGRLFFTPQCPADGDPSAEAFDGAPLPTSPILARVTPDTTPAVDGTQSYAPASPALIAHALARLNNLGPAVAGRGGNAHTRAAWGILVNDLALSRSEATAVFCVWDLGNQPPWGEEAFAGPCREDQAWSNPRGAERERFEAQVAATNVDIFGDVPPQPTHLSVLADDFEQQPQAPVRRYTTGMPELDKLLGGGISTRQAAVMMAPPGDGKSALAVSMSIHVQATIAVLYASTELETSELIARAAAHQLGCPWRDIVDGKIPREQVAAAMKGLRIHFLGCERLPMGEAALQAIEAEVTRLAALYGSPPLVVIDYLQDLARGTDERGVRAKIGSLATIVRAMSQRLDCAMLTISSVSRTYYGVKRAAELRLADDPTVYLAAAKESGDVDYAAAVVLFLDVVGAEPGAGFRCARIAVAKSRHGQTGFVGARFSGASGRWVAGPDDVVASAGKREAARRDAEQDVLDGKVLAAVTQAAALGRFYTARAWRGDERPEGMTDNAVRDALSRLTRDGGPLVKQVQSPLHPGKNAPNGGEYIVPRARSLVR